MTASQNCHDREWDVNSAPGAMKYAIALCPSCRTNYTYALNCMHDLAPGKHDGWLRQLQVAFDCGAIEALTGCEHRTPSIEAARRRMAESYIPDEIAKQIIDVFYEPRTEAKPSSLDVCCENGSNLKENVWYGFLSRELGNLVISNLKPGEFAKQYGTSWDVYGLDSLMDNSSAGADIPWNSSRQYIHRVKIRGGVFQPRSMAHWFEGCENLEYLDCYKSEIDLSRCEDITALFKNCKSLFDIDGLEECRLPSCRFADEAFSHCQSLKTLSISKWGMTDCLSASEMFCDCKSLQSLTVTNWRLTQCHSIARIFCNCHSLECLDLFNWRLSPTTDCAQALCGVDHKSIRWPERITAKLLQVNSQPV